MLKDISDANLSGTKWINMRHSSNLNLCAYLEMAQGHCPWCEICLWLCSFSHFPVTEMVFWETLYVQSFQEVTNITTRTSNYPPCSCCSHGIQMLHHAAACSSLCCLLLPLPLLLLKQRTNWMLPQIVHIVLPINVT